MVILIDKKKESNLFSTTSVPDFLPPFPHYFIEKIGEFVDKKEVPFLRFLTDDLDLTWLENTDDRLGVTLFEYDHNTIKRRIKKRLPPGKIVIGLNPVLLEDKKLYDHTLVHELLHAAGLAEHTERHNQISHEIAPSPTMNSSPLLQRLRAELLSASDKKTWDCENCGNIWARRTIRKPLRCPKCAKKF